MNAAPAPVTVLISGRGSNLRALCEACDRDLPAAVTHVISNRADAAGLHYAEQRGIQVSVVDHLAYQRRADFDAALAATICSQPWSLILLAGFMRRLGAEFCRQFSARLLNIHPSLLPEYRGLDTHARVLRDQRQQHGCSVHFVTAELDGGPIIARTVVSVLPDDTIDTLAARVLASEHRLYPFVVAECLNDNIQLRDDTVMYRGAPLASPLLV